MNPEIHMCVICGKSANGYFRTTHNVYYCSKHFNTRYYAENQTYEQQEWYQRLMNENVEVKKEQPQNLTLF